MISRSVTEIYEFWCVDRVEKSMIKFTVKIDDNRLHYVKIETGRAEITVFEKNALELCIESSCTILKVSPDVVNIMISIAETYIKHYVCTEQTTIHESRIEVSYNVPNHN